MEWDRNFESKPPSAGIGFRCIRYTDTKTEGDIGMKVFYIDCIFYSKKVESSVTFCLSVTPPPHCVSLVSVEHPNCEHGECQWFLFPTLLSGHQLVRVMTSLMERRNIEFNFNGLDGGENNVQANHNKACRRFVRPSPA